MNWPLPLKGKVKFQEPLSRHTTFRIGGPAKIFIEPESVQDLRMLVRLARENRLPLLVIGAGSNILASDKGLDCIVIHLNSAFFKRICFCKNVLEAGSGSRLMMLISASRKRGLSGLEFLWGIPGTLGGALAMNAGIAQKSKPKETLLRSISDLVKDVTVMDYNGQIKNLGRKNLRFSYRRSNLSNYIILSARLALEKESRVAIDAKIKEYAQIRRKLKDTSLPNAGCVFRNPKGWSAGQLIDSCGLKGVVIGGARISRGHANFILNKGNAKAEDVLKLMGLARSCVRNNFNVTLKPEIKLWQ